MRYFKRLIFVFSCLSISMFAAAQMNIEKPDFTLKTIQQSLKSIDENDALTEDQKKQSRGFLESAALALGNATQNKENEVLFRTELENALRILNGLESQIAEQQSLPGQTFKGSNEPMREEALIKLEQDLIARESRVAALRSELEGYQERLQNLAVRQVAAPNELIETRTKLGEITSQLTELGNGELASVGEARRRNLIARRYMRATNISALEREIAGLSKRGEILTARRTLAELKLETLNAEVKYLQEKTGRRRVNEAALVKSDALTTLGIYAEAHPLVQEMARENVALADTLVNLASEGTSISKQGANIRSRLDDVESDLRVARGFIGLGNLDRQAGSTLRRLANQLQAPQVIENQINISQKALIELTQKRLIAQDRLRDLPLGRPDIDTALVLVQIDDPNIPKLSTNDETSYRTLYSQHRDMLLHVSNASTTRINEIVELQNQQKGLLNTTIELKELLDEKLLWVPSVPAVNFIWPQKVLKGALSLFSIKHINLVAQEFVDQSAALWPILLIFAILLGSIIAIRPRLWADIYRREKMVGDVRNDSFWHTPMVILACVIIAIPLPLVFFTSALWFGTSMSPDPLIGDIRDTCLYLAFFSLFFLAWRAWDRDKSLFVSHYKFREDIRSALNKNFRWFIPLAGVTTAIVGLTEDSRTPEIYEGLSLFAFMVSALALAVFSYRVIFANRDALPKRSAQKGDLAKYNMAWGVIFIAVPILAILFAAAGYYETSNKILWRLFISGWLFLLTFVVHGFIRRTVLVAQRQLALREAIAKRDAAVRAREQKAAAEERGETLPLPPPLDMSKIDIKVISHQSSRLLNTLIIIGFAGLMWVIWSDLLPALSVFNDVVIGSYTGQVFDDGGAMIDTKVPITLWNLMQSAVILGLTFIAAKNLPGFLEIFVLNRAGIDAGTRYAIRTVLGYIIVAAGIIIGFDRLGLQWSQLRWIVTGLSVGIGFGLQKIIANFVSGLIILFERPIRIGDYVTIGGESGTVSRIQIRATTLNDWDGREILIPNEVLIGEHLINWTLSSSVTRLVIPIGIAYGSDTDKASEIMLDVLKANPKVLDTPAPSVLFTGFGDSSLDFRLQVFLNNMGDRWPVTHVIHTDINKALEAAGISIPFPQRDLNIVSHVDKKLTPKKSSSKKSPKAT